jgi:hypothetical protein
MKIKGLEKTVDDELNRDFKIEEKSELREVFDNLDNDIENKDSLSKLDFNTRLTRDEINCIMIIEELKQLGIFPKVARITSILKRNNISLNGKGREEKVKIASAKREEQMGGFGARLKGLFGGGE